MVIKIMLFKNLAGSMNTANEKEPSSSIKAATSSSIKVQNQRELTQQPRHQAVMDEKSDCSSPASTSYSKRISSSRSSSENIITDIDSSKGNTQSLPTAQQLKQGETCSPFPIQSTTSINTNMLPTAEAKNQKFQNKCVQSSDEHLLNQSTRSMASFQSAFQQYNPVASPFVFASSAMQFANATNSNYHMNQFSNAFQTTMAPTLMPAAPNYQHVFPVTLASSVHEGYRAIQDNGTILIPQQYLLQSSQSVPSSYYRHVVNPTAMLLDTRQPPPSTLALPQQQLSQLRGHPESMQMPMNSSYPIFYPTGGNVATSITAATRADRIARLTSLLTNVGQQQPLDSITGLELSQSRQILPGQCFYYNANTNTSNLFSINSEEGAAAASPIIWTKSTTSQASHSTKEIIPKARDWEANPAFPKATMLEEGHQIFPVVLHSVLTELERVAQGSDIATFSPDGKSFQIRSQYLFEQQILPVFFPKMRAFASFQRQLNLYNFQRSNRDAGKGRGAYCHELFDRDNPLKAHGMKRTKSKGGTRPGAPRR